MYVSRVFDPPPDPTDELAAAQFGTRNIKFGLAAAALSYLCKSLLYTYAVGSRLSAAMHRRITTNQHTLQTSGQQVFYTKLQHMITMIMVVVQVPLQAIHVQLTRMLLLQATQQLKGPLLPWSGHILLCGN